MIVDHQMRLYSSKTNAPEYATAKGTFKKKNKPMKLKNKTVNKFSVENKTSFNKP